MFVKRFCLAIALMLPAPAFADALLTVTGTASVPMKTDIARITAEMESRGANPSEALTAQRQSLERLSASLAKLGVPAGTLNTGTMALNPQFAPGPVAPGQKRTVASYAVSTQIAVTVPAARIADVWQTLADAGILHSSRATYTMRDIADATAQARAAALKDAMAKAQVLAQESGITLGPIRQINAGNPVVPNGAQNIFETAMQVLTNLPGGQNTVTASVTVGYAIK